jgi:hypothetical protein
MNKNEANKHFPLWRVEFEEYVYGKDSGNSWDDPENDIRKKGRISYFMKESMDDDWQLYYDELFNDFDYAMHQAPLTLYKLRDVRIPTDDDVMFEYHDVMYKLTYYSAEQKCVCGEAIDEWTNEYEDDNTVKVDLVQSYVFLFKKDCIVVKNGNLYLNGEKVISRKLLDEAYGISKYEVEMMYPNSVKNKVKEMFPHATSYSSWCAGGVLK